MGVLQWFGRQRQWRREHIASFSAVSGIQPDGLTLFQHRALAAVARAATPDRFERVPTKSEPGVYLHGPLGHLGHELYIYPNEAAISHGSKPHAIFEEWDYRTPEELIDALVASASLVLPNISLQRDRDG
jgi:hypothetical protein